MSLPVTIKAGPGCGDIMWHLWDFGQEYHRRLDEFPARTAKNRRTLEPYCHRSFCKGKDRWTAWAYHTTKGVTVCAYNLGASAPVDDLHKNQPSR